MLEPSTMKTGQQRCRTLNKKQLDQVIALTRTRKAIDREMTRRNQKTVTKPLVCAVLAQESRSKTKAALISTAFLMIAGVTIYYFATRAKDVPKPTATTPYPDLTKYVDKGQPKSVQNITKAVIHAKKNQQVQNTPICGDGHCMFRAFTYGRERIRGKAQEEAKKASNHNAKVLRLRKKVHTYVMSSKELLEWKEIYGMEPGYDNAPSDEAIQAIGATGKVPNAPPCYKIPTTCWGDHIELRALSVLFNIAIWVYAFFPDTGNISCQALIPDSLGTKSTKELMNNAVFMEHVGEVHYEAIDPDLIQVP